MDNNDVSTVDAITVATTDVAITASDTKPIPDTGSSALFNTVINDTNVVVNIARVVHMIDNANFMSSIINAIDFMDNNDSSMNYSAIVATTDVAVPSSVVTTFPTAGPTTLYNTSLNDTNVVETIDNFGIESTTSSVSSVSSADAALFQSVSQVDAIL